MRDPRLDCKAHSVNHRYSFDITEAPVVPGDRDAGRLPWRPTAFHISWSWHFDAAYPDRWDKVTRNGWTYTATVRGPKVKKDGSDSKVMTDRGFWHGNKPWAPDALHDWLLAAVDATRPATPATPLPWPVDA